MPPLNSFTRTFLAAAVAHAIMSPAQAATITVGSNEDNNGAGCTLREAVVSMNTASLQSGCVNNGAEFGTNDTIDFNLPGSQTITLDYDYGGQLSIAIGKNVTINGTGEQNLTIIGDGANRVFYLRQSTLSINDLTISGGFTPGGGGGIYAFYNASLSLTNSTVSGNSAGAGGGIYAFSSSVSLVNSTVSGNSAPISGGGIGINDSSISMTNSTVSGNSAGTRGGGLAIDSGSISLSNSTVSGNLVAVGVAGNPFLRGGGIYAKNSSSVGLSNNLIAGNVAPYAAEIENYIGTYSGVSTFTADKKNLFGDSSHTNAEAFSNFTPGASDITATSNGTIPTALPSIVSTLADNGGPTQTHALPAYSPALDIADGTVCTTAPVNSQDQRGVARTAVCDIGAFEYQAAATITVNSTYDTSGGANCTLRDAILSSSNNTPSGGCVSGGADGSDQIVFDTGADTTITLLSALPTIQSDLTITGPMATGLTIDAAYQGGVLEIDGANVELAHLTLTKGYATNGGGIYVKDSGSVSISNSTVSGNSAIYGGAISAYASASVSLVDSTVSGNNARYSGGGIFAKQNSSISLTGSTVSGNNASQRRGGGIYVADYSSVSISNSRISGNVTSEFGGGIAVEDSSGVSLINSTVSGNIAQQLGGGISVFISSSVSLSNSTVSNNTAQTYFGGGLWVFYYCSASLINSTVTGNSANNGGGVFAQQFSSISITNSIVTGNSAAGPATEISNPSNDSTFTTSNNLFGDSSQPDSVAFTNFTPDPTDIIATYDGTRPTALSSILEPLADNGGPTETNALVAGSPAINAGDPVICQANAITLDQRGEKRDNICDMGAYEFIEDSSFFVVPLKNGKAVVFSL